MADRLYRSRDDRMLAGVAAGVADALDADPSLVRIVWALLAIFTGGIAFVVYIVMAIVVPEAPDGWPASGPGQPPVPGMPPMGGTPPMPGMPPAPEAPTSSPMPSYWASERDARRAVRRARREARGDGRGGLVIGVILILVGAAFLVRQVVPGFDWDVWWPIGLIGLGCLFLLLALQPGRPSD